MGGAVAVAGGVGIMAVTNPANQATTPATQPSQTQVETTKHPQQQKVEQKSQKWLLK